MACDVSRLWFVDSDEFTFDLYSNSSHNIEHPRWEEGDYSSIYGVHTVPGQKYSITTETAIQIVLKWVYS